MTSEERLALEAEWVAPMNQRLTSLQAAASRMVIRIPAGPDATTPAEEINDPTVVQRLLAGLKCVRPVGEIFREGEAVVVQTPCCLCSGDFEVTVFGGERRLATLLLKHRTEIESSEITNGSRTLMAPDGLAALYEACATLVTRSKEEEKGEPGATDNPDSAGFQAEKSSST